MQIKHKLMVVFTTLLVAACVGGPMVSDPSDGLSFDEGITQIARDIEAALPEGTRMAVVNLESPSARFSDFVLEELQGRFVSGRKLVVTERSRLELLRNEIEFQMSGEVSDESAVSIGHWLGAQVIVTGRLTDIGGRYRCRFSAIDIETAVRQISPAVTVRHDNTIAYMLPTGSALPAGGALSAQVPSRPDPLLATVYFNAGFAHYEAKRYTEAIADFTRALEVKSDDEASLRYRSYSYCDLEDYDKALADFNEFIRLNPNDAVTYYNRGVVYGYKDETEKAIADYNEAVRLNPNFTEAYYNRSIVYRKKKDHDRAIADCLQAIRLNPNLAEAYFTRGNVYADQGDHDRAITDYTEAIRLKPNYDGAYINRGITYYSKGDYARARADCEKTLQISPNEVSALIMLEILRQEGY
jgi:Flp pilus assembly protein TadD